MSQVNDTGHRSYAATAAIAKHALVKAATVSTCTTAGLNDQAIGTADNEAFAAGDVISVSLLSKQGSLKCLASGAFSVNAAVYGRASGKVDDIASGAKLAGVALEAATAADDIVEVMPVCGV
jgi:hypothetical protein